MKLNTKKTIYVGLAFLIICLFWQVYDSIIAKMLINTFGLNQTWSGVVMALDNVLALILLPVFGALSDKTKTKWGKRTPYIFIGVLVSAILFIGVAVFDNLQRKDLENNNMLNVIEVNEQIKDDSNLSSYTEEELNNIIKIHQGDYWFEYDFTNEEIKELFNINKKSFNLFNLDVKNKAKEIRKFFRLTDLELSEESFTNLYNKVLTDADKEEFNELLSMSHEERTKIDNGVRVNEWQIEKLEKRISERISERDDKEELLLSLGIRNFYNTKEYATQARGKIVWTYTKNDIGYLIAFLVILLIVLLAMSTYRTPAVSLMPDVTMKPLRSKANAIINLMGTVGGVISLILMTFLAKDYQSYILLFIIVGVLMISLLTIFMFKVNEPKLLIELENEKKKYNIETIETITENEVEKMPKNVKKSFYLILASIIFWFMAYNAATTKFSVYAGDVLNMGYTVPLLVANVTAIISYIPIGIIASKFGRKKTILVGIVILFTAFFLGIIATEKTKFLLYFTMGIAGIGWATINVNSYPMIVEMSKGSNIGKYTGYYYTASMFAQIITPILSGFFMDAFGTMRVLFPYSVIFCVFAFITMSMVKHGDSKPIPVKNVEAFDIDD